MTITPEKLRKTAQIIEDDAHDIGSDGYFARAKGWIEAAELVRQAADEIERLTNGIAAISEFATAHKGEALRYMTHDEPLVCMVKVRDMAKELLP